MGCLFCVIYTFKCLHNLWLFVHMTHTHTYMQCI